MKTRLFRAGLNLAVTEIAFPVLQSMRNGLEASSMFPKSGLFLVTAMFAGPLANALIPQNLLCLGPPKAPDVSAGR